MRWNPLLSLWNFLGLGRLFSYVLDSNIPILHSVLLFIGSTVWFLATFIQIPIPVKLTLYIGDPVQYDSSKDSIDDVSLSFMRDYVFYGFVFHLLKIVKRSHADLQGLINRSQPHGRSYSNAVKERFAGVLTSWKSTLLEVNSHY